ncbi:hypothetical protein K7X08_004045 [Anisodus acutangulus]|uniref:phosphoethanolamine N-methyltransferase n=1 Tax=Anisodus acutangulus TaxID=402998 RepID=A0A9Q1MGI5_9SOLA|nr:hypothetical protein K7X08_004045 [Anisodus acutangulus]
MRLVRHPNIVELKEVMATKQKIFVMEYVKGGELFAKVANGKLKKDVARKSFQQLIRAVDFYHSCGVFHRDLKPENLLLDENENLKDKPALFRSFYKWLKSGGRVLISDYCKKAGPASEEFAAYIKQRGYDLHDVEAYGQMLRDAGFNEVISEDRTEQFMKVLQEELDIVEKERESFIQEFSEQDYNDIVGGWKAKLIRSSSGEQRWGLFIAKKN